MSYHLYQTKGVVLDSRNIGEENELLFVFTKELGLVSVFAKSIKKAESKLRPSLQKFSWVWLSLIKGKTNIRVTGVIEIMNAYYSFRKEKGKIETLGRIYMLLLRMLQGEERDYRLYKIIENQIYYLISTSQEKKIDLKNFEILSVSRIMFCLGYLSGNNEVLKFIKTDEFSEEIINDFSKYSKKVLKMINNSFEESHL